MSEYRVVLKWRHIFFDTPSLSSTQGLNWYGWLVIPIVCHNLSLNSPIRMFWLSLTQSFLVHCFTWILFAFLQSHCLFYFNFFFSIPLFTLLTKIWKVKIISLVGRHVLSRDAHNFKLSTIFIGNLSIHILSFPFFDFDFLLK